MRFLETDFIINSILLLLSVLLLLIPLMWEIRKVNEIKDRKGKVIRTERVGISKYGIFLLIASAMSLGLGIWKLIRDGKTSENMVALQATNLTATNELRDTINSLQRKLEDSSLQQFKKDSSNFAHSFDDFIKQLNTQDSKRFIGLQNQLIPKGFSLDSKWNLTSLSKASNNVGIFIERGAHHIDVKDNKFIIAPKK